jgi:ElaA protein
MTTTLTWYRFAELSPALLYEVLQFRQSIFVVEQHSPYPDLDGLDIPALHLLLHVDGELAGYLRLIPREAEPRVWIGRVAVASAQRGRGLARQLVAEALGRQRAEFPRTTTTLGAQTYLAPFYRSLGFVPVSAPYDDYGVPHIDMERPADAA